MVNNEIHCISIEQFNVELKNSICLISCKRGRKIHAKYLISFGEPTIKEIHIKCGSCITIDHMLTLLFYSNFDQLQNSFRKTFYRQSIIDTHEQLIERHTNFANWGKLLFEASFELYFHTFTVHSLFYCLKSTFIWQ